MRKNTPQLDQTHLIEQLIKFMAHHRNIPKIPLIEATSYRKGLCLGFSILLAFNTAQDKGIWWKAILETISQTPIEEDALSAKSHLPNDPENSDYPLVYDIFWKTAGAILANQIALEDSVMNRIQLSRKAAGHFSPNDIAFLLDEALFTHPILFWIYSMSHACAIRYSDNQWHFYDPNNKDGELVFDNKPDFIAEITEKLGYSLCFEIAGLDLKAKDAIDLFSQKFQQLYDEKPSELLEGLGLHQMGSKTPENLDKLLLAASTSDQICASLCDGLIKKTPEGQVGFSYLSQNQKNTLLAFSENNEALKNALANAETIKTAFEDFLQTKTIMEEMLIPIAVDIENVCNIKHALSIIGKLFVIIPPYIEHSQLKKEFDTESTFLNIEEAYDPLNLLATLLKNKKISENALLAILMEISTKPTFNSLIKLTLIEIVKAVIADQAHLILLSLQCALIEKIEAYLFSHPDSEQKNCKNLLKLEILEAADIETICTILNKYLTKSSQAQSPHLFKEASFDNCLYACLDIANAANITSLCR